MWQAVLWRPEENVLRTTWGQRLHIHDSYDETATMNSNRLNQENYDAGCDGYDTYITDKGSYNAFAETPAMHQLLGTLNGGKILDFCCGTGRYANWMAAQHPDSDIVGVDFSEQSIQAARQKADTLGLTNVQYHTGSAEMIRTTYHQQFDGIIWGMGLNYFEELDTVFDALQSSLTSRGWLVCSLVHPIIWSGDYIRDDAEQYGRSVFRYFDTEMQSYQWEHVTRTDGEPFVTRNYPYNFERLTAALSNNNLYLDRIFEPQPIPEGETIDPDLYKRLVCCPQFAILKAVKKD